MGNSNSPATIKDPRECSLQNFEKIFMFTSRTLNDKYEYLSFREPPLFLQLNNRTWAISRQSYSPFQEKLSPNKAITEEPFPPIEVNIKKEEDRPKNMDKSEFTGICHLKITFIVKGEKIYQEASGVLIGPCHVLTVSSNLYHSESKVQSSEIQVTPGLNEGVAPFGSSYAAKILSSKDYNYTEHDIAILILEIM